MSLLMLQLILCAVTLIQATSSTVTIQTTSSTLAPDVIKQGSDEKLDSGRNESAVISELMTANNQLQSAVSQLQKEVAEMKASCGGITKTKGELKKQKYTVLMSLINLYVVDTVPTRLCRVGPGEMEQPPRRTADFNSVHRNVTSPLRLLAPLRSLSNWRHYKCTYSFIHSFIHRK